MTPSAALDASSFSDENWAAYLTSLKIPHLQDWMLSQAARGQDYYMRRLDRIRFAGERALDAGCGVGNWSLGLVRRFERVDAIDNDAERVGVLEGIAGHFDGRIQTSVGSVTALPYESGVFDAVFCNGVVFLTDTEAALRELVRVLRPNGRIYVTYNGPGWWRHLLRDRAVNEPVCYVYGANGLITWAFRLASELPLASVYAREQREILALALKENDQTLLRQWVLAALKELAADASTARRANDLLACVQDLSSPGVEPAYLDRLLIDVGSRLASGAPQHDVLVHTYTHRPEDMSALLGKLGMINILSAHEGCLCLDQGAPGAAPIYTLGQDVFESLAVKSP